MSDEVRMGGGFSILPPVVKNLLILNILFFVAKFAFKRIGVDLDALLGLHFFSASSFHFWQPITYMFMHGNFEHLFFNMFALWMFGAAVENHWGSKKFLIYYMVTGFGAGLAHYVVLTFSLYPDLVLMNGFLEAPSWENFQQIVAHHTFHLTSDDPQFVALQQTAAQVAHDPTNAYALNHLTVLVSSYKDYFLNLPNVIGASGAIFGVMMAFAMLFPDSQIYIYFLLPIKAKWFVIFYGVLELVYGVLGTSDGVAHFAHLGGMLFGLILILLWRRKDKQKHFDNTQDEWYSDTSY